MEYKKISLTFEEQADKLLDRGLKSNKQVLIDTLKRINYYRITGYLFPFRDKSSESFVANVSLKRIFKLYNFDDSLRLLVLEGIAIIEVALFRTQLVEFLSRTKGPFGYLNRQVYRKEKVVDKFYERLIKESKRIFESVDSDIKRFRKKYPDSVILPFWIISEKFTFGLMMHLYKSLDFKDKRILSRKLDLPPVVLDSWLQLLNLSRNICAHHSRFWNRKFNNTLLFPSKNFSEDLIDVENYTSNNRFAKPFSVLSIMCFLINRITSSDGWKNKTIALLDSFPEHSLVSLGFPENWKSFSIWQ